MLGPLDVKRKFEFGWNRFVLPTQSAPPQTQAETALGGALLTTPDF